MSETAPAPFPTRAVAAATLAATLSLGVLWWRNGAFMDSDEAVAGNMALRLLHQGQWPVYYWGQEYMGAIEAYLAAPLLWLFGTSVQVLKLVPVLFALVTVPVAGWVGFVIRGRRLAWLTAWVFAAPPLAFALWAIKTRDFSETAELGFWLLAMALATVRSPRPLRWAAAMGLLLGVGLWWSYLVVPYGVVSLLILAVHPAGRKASIWGVGVATTLLGAAPAIHRNAVITHWATITHALHPDASQAATGQPDHAVPALAIDRLVHIGFPAMLGFHDARVKPYVLAGPYAGVAVLLSALAVLGALGLVWVALRSDSKEARLAAGGALGGGVLMTLLFVFSRFGFEPEPRYVLTLWPAIGCSFAMALDGVAETVRVEAAVALLLLLNGHQLYQTHLSGTISEIVQWNPSAPSPTSYRPLIERLLAMGVTHVWADYWTSERITFESNEAVLSADPHDRDAAAIQTLRADPRSCWLSGPGGPADQYARRGWVRTAFGPEVLGVPGSMVLACPP
jgi:hypothetical protein